MEKLLVIKDTDTENWRTAMARPSDFPLIRSGEEVVFEKVISNYYGVFCLVVGPSGSRYYVKPENLQLTQPIIAECRRQSMSFYPDVR